MESEAHQNPLSKVETIEQLRTTIDKLEAIIEQLNSASVVDLPASKSIAALTTTAEELENVIAELAQVAVTPGSQPTPAENEFVNEVVAALPEATPIAPQEQPSETPIAETSETTEPITPKTVTKPLTKPQKKPTKSQKKKNWLAIAIVALIVAIIPISWQYLSPGATPQLLSEKSTEIVTEELPVIATNLPDESLPINEEKPVVSEATKQVADFTINELPNQQIEDLAIAISEPPKQPIEKITEVATPTSITEEIKKSLGQEEAKLIIALVPDLATSATNIEAEPAIASEALESELIPQSATNTAPESLSEIDESIDKKLDPTGDLEIDNIPENAPESEPKILVPTNLVAEDEAKSLDLKTLIHKVKLTPEQNLLATLREKVLQLAEDYEEDIVLSIEPKIANNLLIVKITDDWYQLETTKQDEIVATMFKRSQKLEFRRLEIIDQNDNLVARSPVVGQNMIIFRRDS